MFHEGAAGNQANEYGQHEASASRQDAESDAAANRRRRRRRSTRHGDDEAAERPFFERLEEASGTLDKRNDYVRRLEMRLDELARSHEESKRRLSALEYINDDLEKRLETEASHKLALERRLQAKSEAHANERTQLNNTITGLQEKIRERAAQENILEEKLRRLERELYRMHQRKHEIVQQVRRQEAEERAADQEASQRIRAQTAARGGQDLAAGADATGSSSALPARASDARTSVNRHSRQQNQDEAMAVAYFSQPSSALAEEQNRFRMAESLGHFFACNED